MEIGGEVCQMGWASIKKIMVNLLYMKGDLYVGMFKNGLKHGQGT